MKIGLDIGGTKCAISTGECADGAIKILSREEFPTAGLSWQQVLDEFARRIDDRMGSALPALMSNVVEPSQLASRISLGQFVKALCAALTPVFVYLTATALGNWKLLFPLYGALTVGAAIWLWLTSIPDERVADRAEASKGTTTFAGCFAMMKEPYVAAMTVGILFSVGADVGFSVAIPEYLKNVFKVDVDLAGMGPTVYFVAKTIAAFAGAIAFVAGNDVAAAALGRTLAKIGKGAEQIRLVGFDDVEVAAKLGLTTVCQPLDAIAEAAIQTLVSRIKTPDLPPRTILLNAELVVR